MKNIVRIAAVALVIVMLAATLASCGGLSGTYETGLLGQTVAYEFKGSKVTITVKALGTVVAEVEGKYSIDDDKITFEFESEDSKESDKVKTYNGTFDFEETDDGDIKIGIITYKKQDK